MFDLKQFVKLILENSIKFKLSWEQKLGCLPTSKDLAYCGQLHRAGVNECCPKSMKGIGYGNEEGDGLRRAELT